MVDYEILNPFALLNEKIIHISEAETGLNRDYLCPFCREALIPRKGDINAHHFAHKSSSTNCVYGFEAAIHLMAKEILEQNKKMVLPVVYSKYSRGKRQPMCLFEEKEIEFDKVYVERRINKIIPDIVVEINGKCLLIEIFVTHKIDDIKRQKIIENEYPTIEINLSKYRRERRERCGCEYSNSTQIRLDLERILLSETENKYWVYNPFQEYFDTNITLATLCLEAKYDEDYLRDEMGFKKSPVEVLLPRINCLAEKNSVLVRECENCNYCMEIGKHNDYVLCSFNTKVTTLKELEEYLSTSGEGRGG